MLKTIFLMLLITTRVASFAQKTAAPVAFDETGLYGGCWFVPHNASINIRFSEFGNFTMSDYDKEEGKELVRSGKYLLDGHSLWLIYNDKPRQKFYFDKNPADNSYYIQGYPLKTSAYHFVHGTCD